MARSVEPRLPDHERKTDSQRQQDRRCKRRPGAEQAAIARRQWSDIERRLPA